MTRDLGTDSRRLLLLLLLLGLPVVKLGLRALGALFLAGVSGLLRRNKN
jgi:hypothetical protein